MPEYKEYALQGGQPVRISPFDAAAAGEGVHFAVAEAIPTMWRHSPVRYRILVCLPGRVRNSAAETHL